MSDFADPARDTWAAVTIPITELVRPLGRWFLITVLLFVLPFGVVNGWSALVPPPLSAAFLGDVAVGVAVLVGIYVLSVPIHEGLHAVGMILTGTPRAAITFGAKLRQGVVYIHCSRPMPLTAYRFSLLLPVLLTALLPGAVGVVAGSVWVVLYAALMFISAVGDLEMVWRLRHLPRETLVRDHPKLLGCEVRLAGDGGGLESE